MRKPAAALANLESVTRIVRLLRMAIRPLGAEERRIALGLLDDLVMFLEAIRLDLQPVDDAEPGRRREPDADDDVPFSERPTIREKLRTLLAT